MRLYDTRGSQSAMARYHLGQSAQGMADTYWDAFSSEHQPTGWREMKRRMFARYRAENDRAKEVLAYLGDIDERTN